MRYSVRVVWQPPWLLTATPYVCTLLHRGKECCSRGVAAWSLEWRKKALRGLGPCHMPWRDPWNACVPFRCVSRHQGFQGNKVAISLRGRTCPLGRVSHGRPIWAPWL